MPFIGSAFIVAGASAQDYPARPIRLIVPFAPGGGTDILGRVLATRLSETFGQSVVIDNRGGGGTVIGSELAARAAPDGYTLLLVTSTFSINPSVQPRLPYDPLKDFAPVSLLASTPYLVVVHPGVPATSIREFIAAAKARPGQFTYASVGNGSSTHLATEMFNAMAGTRVVHVPYKGSGPALNDLLGGHVSIYFGSMPASLPQSRGGKLRALAVTGPKRSSAAPELPTIAEAGLPGYAFMAWYGMLAPARTPALVLSRLNTELARTLRLADVQERLAADGSEAVGSTPDAFSATIRADMEKYARIVRQANIRAD